MGPALSLRSTQIAQSAGYASVAGSADVQNFHANEGVFPSGSGAGVEKCPHAAAALKAAQMAEELVKAKATVDHSSVKEAAAACPFHADGAKLVTGEKPSLAGAAFNYEAFYAAELEKKHQDKSYRYFNNINRLAKEFPVAHTSVPEDKVTVWCANDYLGMGKNPLVLHTMQ